MSPMIHIASWVLAQFHRKKKREGTSGGFLRTGGCGKAHCQRLGIMWANFEEPGGRRIGIRAGTVLYEYGFLITLPYGTLANSLAFLAKPASFRRSSDEEYHTSTYISESSSCYPFSPSVPPHPLPIPDTVFPFQA